MPSLCVENPHWRGLDSDGGEKKLRSVVATSGPLTESTLAFSNMLACFSMIYCLQGQLVFLSVPEMKVRLNDL